VVLPLVRHEIQRHLRPVVLLPLVGFFGFLACEKLEGGWGPNYAQLQGALVVHGGDLIFAVVLAAGFSGSSLADERRRGVTLTTLAQGMNRSRYVLGKALGAAASGALVTAAGIACFYLVLGIFWPWGRVRMQSDYGPLPWLFAKSPLANDLVAAAMTMALGAAMPAVAVLVSTLTSNRYIAMAAPLIVLLFTIILKETILQGPVASAVLPTTYMVLGGHYEYWIPAALLPYAAFLYWLAFWALFTALARWIFSRKELV
jgi:ABC-type transport system involved in multi-copper enzyme maturation permease subunit